MTSRRTEIRFPHDYVFDRQCWQCKEYLTPAAFSDQHKICKPCRAARERLRRAGVTPPPAPKHQSRLSAQMAADVEIQERAGAGPVRVRKSNEH